MRYKTGTKNMKRKNALWIQVDEALESIRPYLNADGGNVEIDDITDEKVVKLRLVGACESCPMSFMTMKSGIEQAILRAVPSIKSVEAINTI